HFFSPMPEISRNSRIVLGFFLHNSSNTVSCSTTNAATIFSLPVIRLHSRKNSRNSSFTGTAGAASNTILSTARSEFQLRPLLCFAAPRSVVCIHGGNPAQTSHTPHFSHFTFSPKYSQICLCRHCFPFTNACIKWYRPHALSFSSESPIWLMKNARKPLSFFSHKR